MRRYSARSDNCMTRMKKCALLTLILALSACGEKAPPKKTRADRNLANEQALTSLPETREYSSINGHQLLVVKIPVVQYSLLEYQTCFVWRDKEYKTATMQCEQPPEMDFSDQK